MTDQLKPSRREILVLTSQDKLERQEVAISIVQMHIADATPRMVQMTTEVAEKTFAVPARQETYRTGLVVLVIGLGLVLTYLKPEAGPWLAMIIGGGIALPKIFEHLVRKAKPDA